MSELKMRVVGMEWLRAGDILPHPENWREHSDEQKDAFNTMMEGVGFAGALLTFTLPNGDIMLIDGHLRSDELPDEMLPVLMTDLTEDEARELLATHDPLAALATANKARLKVVHSKLNKVTGRRAALLKKFRQSHGVVLDDEQPADDPGAQVDRAAELQEKWQVERGDVWEVGTHRLMCGDSTCVEDVEKLMDGVKMQGVFTSPPYAMQRKDQYGGIPADEYVEWWDGVQSCVRSILKEDGSFFVNIKPHCEDGERVLYVFDMVLAMKRRWGWRFVDELYWIRPGYPGHYDKRFRNDIEPIFHFSVTEQIVFRPHNVMVKKSINTYGKRFVDKGDSHRGMVNLGNITGDDEYVRPSNRIFVANSATAEHTGAYHPAKFPCKLVEFFIKAYSDDNDSWYDPFLGSGTTIVAAENTGRVGYGMEIAPEYVAVCLERLAGMGLSPRRAIE